MSFPQELPRSMESIEAEILALRQQVAAMMALVEKTLHVAATHREVYYQKSSRPYYPLNDGWALTYLDTGQPFFVNTEDRNITPWIIMGGHWETNVDKVLMAYVTPGMTVVDIGAHFGYYTVKLGGRVGAAGRLFAFEPNPEVNVVCQENIKINQLHSRAVLHKVALGDRDAVATLTRPSSDITSANLLGDKDADYSVEVQVRRLDDLIPADTSIDLIKLDAEGYEKRILDGSVATLARSPRCAIMIELGLERWERGATLDDLIPACGGGARRIYAVQPDGTIRNMSLDQIRPFLLTCAFHENYFLIGHQQEVEVHVGTLLSL